jgi:two-component system nitrogen regulation response regulator NtrX
MHKGRILIVDDEESIVQTLADILRDEGFEVWCASDGNQALTRIQTEVPDVVLLDIWLPQMDGIEALRALKEMRSDVEVIVMSGHGNIETAVKATKLGAFDYIEKPLSLESLLLSVRRALSRHQQGQEAAYSRLTPRQMPLLIGGSPQINAVRHRLEEAWTSDIPVLIQGEPGSGKELVAQLLHNGSERREGPFVKCHCAILSEPAIERALFGCTSDAHGWESTLTKGYLELANGGTIFIDGIDFLQQEVQRKLLHAMQARAITRVGGRVSIPLNIRLVVSCTMELDQLQEQEVILPELAMPLRQLYIKIPALRERKADIPALTHHFLRVFAYEYGQIPKEIDDDALGLLVNYDWPGNVKELKNIVERMVINASTHRLGRQDVPLAIQGNTVPQYWQLAGYASYHDAKRDWERTFLRHHLHRHNWRLSEAARHLRMSERSLQRKITMYGMQSPAMQIGYQQQRTLRRSMVLYGQGLQSGLKTGIILSPLPPNSGIVFSNITSGELLPASIDHVESTDFCTSLRKGRIVAKTIEHIMSVLHAYHISNLLIKISDEVPIMDGSAVDFCGLIEEGGIEEQNAAVEELVIDQCYYVGDIKSDAKFILIEPYDGFRVTYRLDYPQPLGIQELTYEHHNGAGFRHEIAPARTFGFVRDAEKMQELGLLAGGRLNNVILIDDEKIVNNTRLRFPDEFARHKVLDIIGDLYLLGKPLRGHVRANMTGHTENIALLRKLRATMLST